MRHRQHGTNRHVAKATRPLKGTAENVAVAAGGGPERHTNKATVRILEVLSLFADTSASLGVTEVSRRLGISKNMAFRALTTLLEEGYLVRDPSGQRYDLGFRVVELQNPNFSEPDIVSLATPFMERILNLTQETVLLVVPVEHRVVVLYGLEGKGAFVRRIPLGMSVPLHASSGSRAVLACLSDEEIDAYLRAMVPLARITPRTITDPKKLWAEIRVVRQRGYAIGMGDYMEGVLSVAFPILDPENRPHGALAIGGPKHRFTQQTLAEFLPQLRAIAEELNALSRLYYVRDSVSYVD